MSGSAAPWRMADYWIYDALDRPIAVAFAIGSGVEREVNARLMAAAPELRQALHLAKAMLDPENQPPQWTRAEALARIDAVLAKAEGVKTS